MVQFPMLLVSTLAIPMVQFPMLLVSTLAILMSIPTARGKLSHTPSARLLLDRLTAESSLPSAMDTELPLSQPLLLTLLSPLSTPMLVLFPTLLVFTPAILLSTPMARERLNLTPLHRLPMERPPEVW